MAFSSGARHALSEAFIWLIGAVCLVAGIIYLQEIKQAVSAAFGLPGPGQSGDAGDNRQGGRSYQRNADRDKQRILPGLRVEIQAGRGGHFYADARINGSDSEVLVDTGATHVSMSDEAARAAGIYLSPSDFTWRSRTANGIAKVAPVRLDSVSIGDIIIRDVQAVVHEPGTLSTKTLLGMSFLSRLSNVGIRNGRLILEE